MLTAEHVQSLDASSWERYQRACEAASSPNFVVVPGVEYRDEANLVHVPVWGRLPLFSDGIGIGDLLHRVAEAGGVAVLAHPGRRMAMEQFDPAWGPLVSGIEIWNRKYDGWAPNAAAVRLADTWGVPTFCALDFHGRRQFFPLSMRYSGQGPLNLDAVCAAMREHSMRPEFIRMPVEGWTGGRKGRTLGRLEQKRQIAAPWFRVRRPRTRAAVR